MGLSKVSSVGIVVSAIVGSVFSAYAQDTLRVNIEKADSIFFNTNYVLLASSMNIEAEKAQILQAKLYPNPVFTADFNAYDPQSSKVFHVGASGQKVFQVEQLILLGGKRKTEIEIAKKNAFIAELEFQQLWRQLKFRLHSDLFALGQMKGLLNHYNAQLSILEGLLQSYEYQANKGNIPLKDVVRLKGAYLKLNNDRAELLKGYFETQSDLQTMLQTNAIVDFQFAASDIEKYIQPHNLVELKEIALTNHPKLLIIKENKVLAETYLTYQKRLAIPDINLFTSYDQRGGAFNNQVNTGFSIPLPIWSRNQGNIKTWQFRIKDAEFQVKAVENEVLSELQNGLMEYSQIISEYQKANALYNSDFETTLEGMTDNFQKQNVNIIEFLDFFESYNETLNEMLRIKTQLVISAEQLNLLTGKDIY